MLIPAWVAALLCLTVGALIGALAAAWASARMHCDDRERIARLESTLGNTAGVLDGLAVAPDTQVHPVVTDILGDLSRECLSAAMGWNLIDDVIDHVRQHTAWTDEPRFDDD